MSEFYGSVFRDGEKQSQRLIRDVGRALLPATASRGVQGAMGRSAALPTPYPSTQHADGENIQTAMTEVDSTDSEYYLTAG